MTAVRELPPLVDPATLDEVRQDSSQVRLIDVRTPAEFESVHIPGSYNVPLDQLGEHRQELRDVLGVPTVLICRTGGRARQAEQALKESGLSQLHVLEGGIVAWEMSGKPVRRGQERWSLERQVRGLAGGLTLLGALGGLLVWPPLTAIAALIGAGLFTSALTNTCGMAMVLAKLPYNQGASCDMRQVIAELSDNRA